MLYLLLYLIYGIEQRSQRSSLRWKPHIYLLIAATSSFADVNPSLGHIRGCRSDLQTQALRRSIITIKFFITLPNLELVSQNWLFWNSFFITIIYYFLYPILKDYNFVFSCNKTIYLKFSSFVIVFFSHLYVYYFFFFVMQCRYLSY